ncbi:GNAT family N-acetyltransferase [Candidatus Woesearchaeota archaeon]|nr:GNAT family N-acetyltransferase [Candidatus Woesearchaeota archaeon]MBT7169511.1 GNAT family N-acetyltransferase [Candidatus Woesearchaeota archaeon]MBT7557127.1 GNAT family N-acetyltransferase [Candidatus Woesearchaeota archaeon]
MSEENYGEMDVYERRNFWMNSGIGKMHSKDIDQVDELGSNVEEFRTSENESTFWPRNVLEDLVSSEDDVTLVARKGNKVIGFLIATYHPVTRKATWENCYVSPEYRGREIAGKMYSLAEKTLREKGADFICGFIEQDNMASKNFVRKHNLEEGKLYNWMTKFL